MQSNILLYRVRPLMFPHSVDNFRLAVKLVRTARERRAWSQQTVAHAAGLVTGTMTHLENMANRLAQQLEAQWEASNAEAAQPVRTLCPIRRTSLLLLLAHGLKFQRDYADTILWLCDYPVTTEREAGLYNLGRATHDRTPEALRALLRSQLQETVDPATPGGGIPAHVAVFGADPEGRKHGEQAYTKLFKIPGQRMIVVAEADYRARTGDWDRATVRRDIPDEVKPTVRAANQERDVLFRQYLGLYGERSIRHLDAVRDYATNPEILEPSFDERQAHIRNWVILLNNNKDKYQVALAPATPVLEMTIKTSMIAITNVMTPVNIGGGALWGPHYFRWEGEIAWRYYLDFEAAWDLIDCKAEKAIIKLNSYLRRPVKL